MRKIVLLLAIGCVASPAAAQIKALDKVNGFLSKLTGRPVAGGPAAPAVSAPSASIVVPSAEQVATMGRTLASNVAADIAADRQAAHGLIADLVTTSACATDGRAWNRFNRVNEKPITYTTDNTNSVPMLKTRYHNKSQCLDVIRIDDWAKPAKNALTFKVRLISPQSDEATYQNFTLVRQPSNEWMVRDIGGTYA